MKLEVLSNVLLIPLIIILISCNSEKSERNDYSTKSILSEPKNAEIPTEYIDTLSIDTLLLKHQYYRPWQENIHAYYSKRDYQLAWSRNGQLIPQVSMFLNIIINLDKHGLISDLEESSRIKDLHHFVRDHPHPESDLAVTARKSLDIFLTASFFKHASQMWGGVIDPEEAKLEWYTDPKEITYDEKLDSIIDNTEKYRNPFLEYEPLHPEYKKLKIVLDKYKEINRNGGWPMVEPVNKQLIKGDTGEVIVKLKKRLFAGGDLPVMSESNLFDAHVKKAVKSFQERHGLKPDGIVKGKTLKEINKPVSERITQIIINMERWRWVPERISDSYIIVNIPEFKLHVYEPGKDTWQMNVIVGKAATHTPVFNDEINHIVFSPSWTLPKTIAVEEILPALKRNPDFLESRNMELFDGNLDNPIQADTIRWDTINEENFRFTIRQKPGLNNALGRVKFMFPNRFMVYLHDTPYGKLFSEEERDFSYGCIRVEEPVLLAQHLLKGQGNWTNERITEAMNSEEEIYVKLQKKMPVYIVYFTTWVDDNDHVHFRNDIYGHDEKLSQLYYNKLHD
ncbi:L,D-transpeptidase family protein [Cytophagaceae bacterium ABcell3]|nr:L,D-transpeptidase family protein [Cytophagaceae bacterium ABcell3]